MSTGEEELKEEYGEDVDYHPYFQDGPEFPSRDAALEWCRNIALQFGFLLTITSHKKRADGLSNQYLSCDRARKKKLRDLSSAIRRNTKRKGCNCPFRVLLVPKNNYQCWEVVVEDGRGWHNHPLIEYPEGHQQISGLSPAAKKVVSDLSGSHVKPSQIMHLVKDNFPNLNPNIRQIYNCRYRLRKDRMGDRNAVQEFLHLAVDHGYLFWLQSDEEGTVTHTFISHPQSVKMFRTWPHVIHIDATYKTNKYSYPLVEVVGVTPTNRSFSIGWALLKNEDALSYRWLLEKLKYILGEHLIPNVIVTDRDLGLIKYIRDVFPDTAHLLCVWHINNDTQAWVIKKCGGSQKRGAQFAKGSWAKVMGSKTEAEYERNVRSMMRLWGNIGKQGDEMISFPDYINSTWLRYKERFILCWTDRVRHFGNTTNNRCESSHSSMKNWIAAPTQAMDTLFLKIHGFIEGQLIEIKNDLEFSVRTHGTEFNGPPLSALNGHCSNFGLRLIQKQLNKFRLACLDPDRCDCGIQVTHGLPCGCQIFNTCQSGELIHLQDVDPFWITLKIGKGVAADLIAESEQDRQFFQSLVEEISQSDPAVIRSISQVMYSELHPEHLPYVEPEGKKFRRGPLKFSKGMRREKSGWEYGRGTRGRRSSRRGRSSGSSGGRGRSSESSANISSSTDWRFDMNNFPYYHRLPLAIHRYIEGWLDVLPDGNCGFRCVADEFCGGQDNWDIVRRAALGELNQNGFLYHWLYGDDLTEALNRIEWEGADCTQEHYLEAIQDFYPIANHYKCTIFFFSLMGGQLVCNTIFPMEVGGNNAEPRRELAIAHLGTYKHFIRLQLTRGHPVPIIPPQWYTNAHHSCASWSQFYQLRELKWVEENPGIYREVDYVDIPD